MAGLVWRKAFGQILPACPASQNPENAVDHFAPVTPWTPPAVGAAWRFWYERANDGPLFIGEFFTSSLCHVKSIANLFMRLLVVTRQSVVHRVTQDDEDEGESERRSGLCLVQGSTLRF